MNQNSLDQKTTYRINPNNNPLYLTLSSLNFLQSIKFYPFCDQNFIFLLYPDNDSSTSFIANSINIALKDHLIKPFFLT